MTHLTELGVQLLIGTDRREPDWPAPAGELGTFVARLSGSQDAPEIRALRIAGALAVCAEAGYQPPEAGYPPLPPCPAETQSVATAPELVATLQAVLDEGPDSLRAEALRRLSDAGQVLPPRLLPRALALGVRHDWLRPLLPSVVGERGHWLAHINPDWSAALTSDANLIDPSWWDEGTLEQRGQFLAALRAEDPAEARRRLADTFGETNARGRARLLATLDTGLSLDDEPFLESCLKDCGKEVRQQAAALLAHLPDSRYVARMTERVSACLASGKGMLRTRIEIEPPETFDPDWKKDGIEESHPQSEALGPRAWWLYQMARALPLSWWTARTGMDARDCLRWSKGTDWELALLRAWIDALGCTPDPEWSAALLDRLPIKSLYLDPFDLVDALPPAERERAWLDLTIEASKRSAALGETLSRIAQTLSREGAELSTSAASRLIDHLKKRLASGKLSGDYVLRRTLPEFIGCLPPESLTEAASGWPIDRPELQFFADTLAQVLAVIKHRQTLIHHLQEA